MSFDINDCEDILWKFLYKNELSIPRSLESIKEDKYPILNAQMDHVLELMQDHYNEFQKISPESLDAKLMYYPDGWNPLRMITSALSHASWEHIIFNLIFFFAFAPALELLIGNNFKYIGVLVLLAIFTHISYSLVSLVDEYTLPSLGLSGVVMGMIGLSAYLMPTAKIRVLIWLLFYVRTFFISAWVLAIWYIGWDTWDLISDVDNGGVNLVAHVSGGIAGFLIGFFLLKDIKEDTREELADEIEYQRSKRADRFTSFNVSYSGNRRYIENKQQERQFKKDEDQYMDRLYQYVITHNDSEAILLIMDDYDFQRVYVENYEDLFNRIKEWGASHTLLCMGRVCISLLIEKRLYKRALVIMECCRTITDEFVLADPAEVLLLAWGAINLQQYESAYSLIHDAEQHYGTYIDVFRCRLIEVELLWMHMERHDEARFIIKGLLSDKQNPYRLDVLNLAKCIQ